MSECDRCTRPVQDAHICTTCGHDLEKALNHIPQLAAELDITISRQQRFTEQTDGGRSASTPLAFHDKASEVYWTLRNILIGWTKLYVETTQPQHILEGPTHRDCLHISCSRIRSEQRPWPEDTLTAMSRFLLSRAEWLRHHELAADAADEITHAVRNTQHVIDAPANRTTFPVGPCPELDEQGEHCPGQVRAYIPSSEADPAYMACANCAGNWATWQWLRLGKRILDRQQEISSQRVA